MSVITLHLGLILVITAVSCNVRVTVAEPFFITLKASRVVIALRHIYTASNRVRSIEHVSVVMTSSAHIDLFTRLMCKWTLAWNWERQ